MDKQTILDQLCELLRKQLATMTEAAKAAHLAATDEDSKQESKYDTRGLEASYLADAQAEQSQQLAESLHIFESLDLGEFPSNSDIAPGALVETESGGLINHYLLTPCAGGLDIPYDMGKLTTLSPEAPLYQKLLGLRIGDIIEDSDTLILDIQ